MASQVISSPKPGVTSHAKKLNGAVAIQCFKGMLPFVGFPCDCHRGLSRAVSDHCVRIDLIEPFGARYGRRLIGVCLSESWRLMPVSGVKYLTWFILKPVKGAQHDKS